MDVEVRTGARRPLDEQVALKTQIIWKVVGVITYQKWVLKRSSVTVIQVYYADLVTPMHKYCAKKIVICFMQKLTSIKVGPLFFKRNRTSKGKLNFTDLGKKGH